MWAVHSLTKVVSSAAATTEFMSSNVPSAVVLAALGTMAVKHAIEQQARSVPVRPWRRELLGRTALSVPPSGDFRHGARRQNWRFGAAVGFIIGGGLVYGSPAMAACMAGNPGASDFICSGADTNIAIAGGVTNTTVVLQGDTVSGAPGQVGVSTTGAGTLGFALNGASSITSAGGNALSLTTVDGDLSTNASPPNTSGINGINGVISATGGRGVNAITTGLGNILLNMGAPRLTARWPCSTAATISGTASRCTVLARSTEARPTLRSVAAPSIEVPETSSDR
jgi:hypothetical protein